MAGVQQFHAGLHMAGGQGELGVVAEVADMQGALPGLGVDAYHGA